MGQCPKTGSFITGGKKSVRIPDKFGFWTVTVLNNDCTTDLKKEAHNSEPIGFVDGLKWSLIL